MAETRSSVVPRRSLQIQCPQAVYAARHETLDRAFATNPERFVKKAPKPPAIPTAVWINPPTLEQKTTGLISRPGCLRIVDTFRHSPCP